MIVYVVIDIDGDDPIDGVFDEDEFKKKHKMYISGKDRWYGFIRVEKWKVNSMDEPEIIYKPSDLFKES